MRSMRNSKFVCANIVLQQNVAKLLIVSIYRDKNSCFRNIIFMLKIIGRDWNWRKKNG